MKEEIPWNRYGIEAIVIVSSILLAFSIDAWWGYTQEQRSQNELLFRLEAAFVENIELIDELSNVREIPMNVLPVFLDMEATQVIPDLSSKEVQRIFFSMLIPMTSSYNHDLLFSLIESTNSILLDEADLLEAIASWQGSANTLETRREQLRWHEQETRRALGQHSEIRPFLRDLNPTADAPSSGAAEAIRAAVNDDDILSLAYAKSEMLSVNVEWNRRLRSQAEIVLNEIRSIIN
jgi:hypothetical protein